MKILHVFKDYHPVIGGIENHIKLLAEGQARAGHDVTVLTTNRSRKTEATEVEGVRVIRTARVAAPFSTPLSVRLPRELRRLRPDVTHLHFPYPLAEIAQHVLGRSRHTVLTYHCDILRQPRLYRLYRPILRRILTKVDRIVVTHPRVLDGHELLAAFSAKCRLVTLGINYQRFQVPPLASSVTKRLASPAVVLFVGVLRHYKGLTYLLEAMRQVDARLLIVGDGPMGPSLRARARELGVEQTVTFVGSVSTEELSAYYHAADVFVLPASSSAEAFGLVQLEAMAAGLPVVCTEVGTGTSYVNRHGRSGLVVPPRDANALAGAINRLLGDANLRNRLAAGARARVLRFGADRMLRETAEVYAELFTAHAKAIARSPPELEARSGKAYTR